MPAITKTVYPECFVRCWDVPEFTNELMCTVYSGLYVPSDETSGNMPVVAYETVG